MTSRYTSSRMSLKKSNPKEKDRHQAAYLRRFETGQNEGGDDKNCGESLGNRDVDMDNGVQEDTTVVQSDAKALQVIAFTGVVIRDDKAVLHRTQNTEVAEPVSKRRRTSCTEQPNTSQRRELSLQSPLPDHIDYAIIKRTLDAANKKIEILERENERLKDDNMVLMKGLSRPADLLESYWKQTAKSLEGENERLQDDNMVLMKGLSRPADPLESYWKQAAKSLEEENKKLKLDAEIWTDYENYMEPEFLRVVEENDRKDQQNQQLENELTRVENERNKLVRRLNKTYTFVKGGFDDDDEEEEEEGDEEDEDDDDDNDD